MKEIALLVPILFLVFTFVTILIIVNNRYKLRVRQLDAAPSGAADAEDIREELDQLTIEVAALKRENARIKQALQSPDQRIELTPYEREQLKIDQNDKFSY